MITIQNVSMYMCRYIYIYIHIYIEIWIYISLGDTANRLDHMYNYVYVIEQSNAKINMREQNQFICNILQFYRWYNIINVIMEQFLHNNLQFLANAYKDNMINELHYTYWQDTVDCIDHILSRPLGKWVASYSSHNLYIY